MSDHPGRWYSAEDLFLVQVLNHLEALGNLNHLIGGELEDPEAVRSYLKQSEAILRELAGLACSRCRSAA